MPTNDPGTAPTDPLPIRRNREVRVFHNRYGSLYNDEVVSPSGAEGRYLRWRWSQAGVVVVPTGPRGWALVPTFRYPLGRISLEFPRGGCEPGEALHDAAARELKEETGFDCRPSLLRPLGILHAETGLIESGVHVFTAEVTDGGGVARPEAMESVTDPVWLSRDQALASLCGGRITCGVTLAAFALVLADGATASPQG